MNEPRVPRLAALALAASLASACLPSLQGNEPREAKKEVPGAFPAPPPTAAAKENPAAGPSLAQKHYADFFESPELKALIKTALENNQELNIRMQEIVIAKAEVKARKGEYLPKVDAGAGVGLDKVGRYTSPGASNEANGVGEPVGDFTFGLSGSWEVDVWKKLRNGAKAANYRYLSSIEGRNFMVTQLVAEIARSYYELVALDSQLDVLKRNIQIQTDALEVVKLEKQAARVTELAVQRFEAEVLKNKSRQFELEQARVVAENRINFLVGRFPQPVARSVAQFQAPLPAALGAGLPSELLDNRPDVKQAGLELEAAKLDVKAAKASFYPSLSIDAGVGYDAFDVQYLVTTPESLIYNAAGHLTAPLLNRSAIAAKYRTANARQLQAVFNYERAILQAFTDVVNQLAKVKNLKQSYELREKQVQTLEESVAISNVLFQSARADYMEVLLTRRDTLDAEMELILTRLEQFDAMISLYQALGGGWM